MPESQDWVAHVTLPGLPPKKAQHAYRALIPEMGEVAGKSTVSIAETDGSITLTIRADSLSALRAALNAYLRWLIMVDQVEDIADRALVPPSPPA